MAGSDDRTSDHRGSASGDRGRSSVRKAEPAPLTEAMIKPRSDRWGSEETTRGGPRFCHSCGELNESGGSYCLSCGVSFRAREGIPAPRAGSGPDGNTYARQAASEPELPASGGGGNERGDGQTRQRAARGSIRTLVVSIAVIASLVLGFRTLASRDTGTEAPAETVPSTTTATTLDTVAVRLYGDQVSMLGADVAEVAETGRRINDEWDDRTAEYQATKDRMRALVSRATVLPARMAEIAVPPTADPVVHRQMLLEIATLVSAAEGMMAGLESTDAGETRLSELARFESAAREFGSLADQVERSLGSGLRAGGSA